MRQMDALMSKYDVFLSPTSSAGLSFQARDAASLKGPAYLRSIFSDLMMIGVTGLSPGLVVLVLPILLRTSIPSTTSPKTVCLRFSQVVGASVMKNWLQFVFGPELALVRFLSCSTLRPDQNA